VGIVYSSALAPLLVANDGLVDVVEVEPQTTWIETGNPATPLLARDEVVDHLASLPGQKLVHSVGAPVGGTVPPDEEQLRLLREAVDRLAVPWASEHLAFNRTDGFFTGFFLPPRQTDAGVQASVTAVRRLQDALGIPIAVETGVNYLRPRRDEMPDGEFVAAVVEEAGCGILLDLHNAYCNERNGRESVERFVASLPLDRVWEVHLAGGFELGGYWLDAHSGAVPPDVEAYCRQLLPSLPNLKATVFEVFSSFLPHVGIDGVRRELEKLHELWGSQGTAVPPPSTASTSPLRTVRGGTADPVSPREWEQALGRLVVGHAPETVLEHELAADPGVPLVRSLVEEFRASMVVGVHRLSSRLLMLALGPDIFRALLADFWSSSPPEQFAGTEAERFADYLVAKNVRVPQFQAILAFERAALATVRDGESRVVRFDVDPLPMLRSLIDGVLLQEPGSPGEYEIELTAEDALAVVGAGLGLSERPLHRG
jgi:uncharacterized protein (UPF0276 family)